MRGYYLNSKYLKMKKAAIVIQSNTRRLLERYTVCPNLLTSRGIRFNLTFWNLHFHFYLSVRWWGSKNKTKSSWKCSKNDHRSQFSNLSNWKEAWKKSGLQLDSNPWPPWHRCDALPTELWSHTLEARSIYWAHMIWTELWSRTLEARSIYWAHMIWTELWSHTLDARSIYWVHLIWTELWSHTLEARSTYWVHMIWYELNKLTSLPMCGFIAQLVEHRTGIAEVMGSNPVEALIFFRLLLSNCLNWKINCDDHSSLSSTTAVHIWIIS